MSECRVISVSNQKGGVGKTTTACNLAAGLKEKGYRVLLIDLDPQGNLGFSVGADADAATIYDVLKGSVNARFAVQKTDTADIIPSNILLSGIELEYTGTGREYLLRDAVAPLHKYYDFILIDTPPALSILTINAFTASDSIIVPMLCDIFSLQGIAQLYDTVERIKKYSNSKLRISGILLLNANPKTHLSQEIRGTAEMISKDLNIPVFNTFIRKSVLVSEAQTAQESVLSYAPKNNASVDYRKFVNELLKLKD